jgi:hypothetical protein
MNKENIIKEAIELGYTCNPETGNVYGRKGKLLNAKLDGYKYMNINGKSIKQHQFIYYFVNGNLPKVIDHIDRDKLNNEITNLRDVSKSQNSWNQDRISVNFCKTRNKYVSRIGVNGNRVFIGYFNSYEDAKIAYLDAKKKYHKI